MTTVLDRAVAALGLLLAAPLLALSALGIKGSSRGPVLYRATRVGRDGRLFTMYKLRTMHHPGTHETASAARITPRGDHRVFPFGRFLRRTRLDEVPQLVNVLRGDMSLVGPRPEDPGIVHERSGDALMREALAARPGLTSPGSLHYLAEERDLPADPGQAERVYLDALLPMKTALDLVYVRNASAGYAAEVLVRTIAGVLGVRSPFRRRAARELRLARAILGERGGA